MTHVGINWTEHSRELKRRRERAGLTQDQLAAKAGVRLATIARLEIGNRRPSLGLLETLAKVLACRVRDLLPEEEDELDIASGESRREPSLRGAPTFFRGNIAEAARTGYEGAGHNLSGVINGEFSDEAHADLRRICGIKDADQFRAELTDLVKRELPGCLALVPARRLPSLIMGLIRAIAEGKLDEGSATAERIVWLADND